MWDPAGGEEPHGPESRPEERPCTWRRKAPPPEYTECVITILTVQLF